MGQGNFSASVQTKCAWRKAKWWSKKVLRHRGVSYAKRIRLPKLEIGKRNGFAQIQGGTIAGVLASSNRQPRWKPYLQGRAADAR